MEVLYSVMTLERGVILIPFQNNRQFIDDIENITGILSVYQRYYRQCNKINLSSLRNAEEKYLELVPIRKESSRYYIKTPSAILKLSIL